MKDQKNPSAREQKGPKSLLINRSTPRYGTRSKAGRNFLAGGDEALAASGAAVEILSIDAVPAFDIGDCYEIPDRVR
ncbi:hypothetical protein ACC730_37900, partial [Rhizobium ruizarguesonis]